MPAQLVDGRAGGLPRSRVSAVRALPGSRVEHPAGAGRLHAHDRHVVGDHVVQLAGDADPLAHHRALAGSRPATRRSSSACACSSCCRRAASHARLAEEVRETEEEAR